MLIYTAITNLSGKMRAKRTLHGATEQEGMPTLASHTRRLQYIIRTVNSLDLAVQMLREPMAEGSIRQIRTNGPL